MKRLVIDVNSVVPEFVCGKVSGIGRTTKELLETISGMTETLPFEVMLYSQNMKGGGARNLNTRFLTKHLYMPHRPMYDRIVQRLHLKELLTGYDLIHIPHNIDLINYPERCILTIHDAMFMRISDSTSGTDNLKTELPPIARKCKHIFTCSESSKRDIVDTMGVAPKNVSVVYWGINHDMFRVLPNKEQIQTDLAEKYNINAPYYFSVSCNSGRKRIDKLVHAYIETFRKQSLEHDLVLAWRNAPQYVLDEVNAAHDVNGHIHILSDVNDVDLAKLYNCAKVTFFPSMYEGFGLPIIESMACGTPVVTCHNSCLDEIAGDAGIYLDEPIEDNFEQMLRSLEDADLSEYISKGLERAKMFTWENAAKKYVKVYSKLLED
ncbi:MAG: glycosyltransferase family 4 protein [Bacteroidaceae bacterium]|nr:glycosyltransferase family 4 protein [Bacteroidaceae bacterium]